MADANHDQKFSGTVHLTCAAKWTLPGIVLSNDPAAKDFGPAVPPRFDHVKPVRYVPVKRASGKEHVPALAIEVTVLQQGSVSNVQIPGLAGAAVKIKVANVFEGQFPEPNRKPTALQGQLDAKGHCVVKVPASQVAAWIDAKKTFGRINETLLDFTVEIPSASLTGNSLDRVYLYRRKAVVFLPGVFGSQVNVKTPDGRTLGFPDLYDEKLPPYTGDDADLGIFLAQLWNAKHSKVGGLECDEDGKALVEPIKPTLVRFAGFIYDTFTLLHKARVKWFPKVPDDMRIYEVWLHCYDWRLDLTEAAVALAKRLKELQADLRKRLDYDDEVALAGHSTGGVIMRRALGLEGMASIVSHAFFLNVPFLGAPKAIGVVLSGQDPPGGDAMIPIVTAESLRDIALSMPIVYHLAPTPSYGRRVGFCATRPPSASVDVEADKKAVVTAALDCGLLPRPMAIRSSVTNGMARARLATTSDDWHQYWADASERHRGDLIYEALFGGIYPLHYDWFTTNEAEPAIAQQKSARHPAGWSAALAAKAVAFHKECERIAKTGAWAKKAFVFYSVAADPTTLEVTLEEETWARRHVDQPLGLVPDDYWTTLDGDVTPDRDQVTIKYHSPEGESPCLRVHQWSAAPGGGYDDRLYRAWGRGKARAGDGTVPVTSLRAFGGPATIFAPTVGGPKHVPAPNVAQVWERIVRALQGVVWDSDVEESPDEYDSGRPGASGSW